MHLINRLPIKKIAEQWHQCQQCAIFKSTSSAKSSKIYVHSIWFGEIPKMSINLSSWQTTRQKIDWHQCCHPFLGALVCTLKTIHSNVYMSIYHCWHEHEHCKATIVRPPRSVVRHCQKVKYRQVDTNIFRTTEPLCVYPTSKSKTHLNIDEEHT